MKQPQESTLLRIYIGESDRSGHSPLYEALVAKAREHGLAGATVLRGVLGYGASSVMHTAKLLELSEDLPMVIEIIDERSRIEAFVETLESWMSNGLVTMERVHVVKYGEPR